MDGVEKRNRILGLVGLQLADQVEAQAGNAGPQRGPLGLRFLHPILAEVALALGDQRLDRFGRLGLGDRDQGHRVRLAPGQRRRLGDPRPHLAGGKTPPWLLL